MSKTKQELVVEGVRYTLLGGRIEDVQNRSETAVWGGGGGGRVHNGTGHVNEVTIKSSTTHWKDVRLRWNDGTRDTIVLPGHVNAVIGDEVEVLFADVGAKFDLGAVAYRNKTEGKLWWWNRVDEKVMTDGALRAHMMPGYGTAKFFGTVLIYIGLLPFIFAVIGAFVSGQVMVALLVSTPFILGCFIGGAATSQVTNLKARMDATAERLITDFRADEPNKASVMTVSAETVPT
ncbi:MAG: hypothetical protein K2X57_03425 [Xanthobacteraceae bacterium]|nr:hypothetical protein [Xanthobacteraceae bacterium]MBY0611241.1 hypothetical protein [Beijerinckiaceae bacterium]